MEISAMTDQQIAALSVRARLARYGVTDAPSHIYGKRELRDRFGVLIGRYDVQEAINLLLDWERINPQGIA
jgi:hypothetical protein